MKYFIASLLVSFLVPFTGAFAVKHTQREESGIPLRKSKRMQVKPTVEAHLAASLEENGEKRKKRKRVLHDRKGKKKRVKWAELPSGRNGKEGLHFKMLKVNAKSPSFMDVERTLAKEIELIQKQIAFGHERADPSCIRRAYKSFEKLPDYPDGDRKWKTYARQLGACRWPSQQSWKEVVGGHLFFPQGTFDWEIVSCEEYRLTRSDNLWAYAVAAKFKHAVGKYYLVRMLDKLRGIYYEDRPAFFDQLYREAFGDLKQCGDNPDACYVIGYNYHAGVPHLSACYVEKDNTPEYKDLTWHSRGRDLKNQYQVLRLKKSFPRTYGPVTAEEFLTLARAGYGPAYEGAHDLVESNEEKESILREAIEADFKPALLWLGRHYRKRGEKEKGEEYYLRAGEEGISRAYVGLGILKIGNLLYRSREKRKDLTGLTSDEIDEGIEWFTRAGEAHNPEGWEYLVKLYAELQCLKLIEKDDFEREYVFCLREGMRLGSKRAYIRSFKYFTEESINRLREKYGEQPHAELRLVMKEFLSDIN